MCYGNIEIKTQIQVTLSNLSLLQKLDKKFLGIKIKPLQFLDGKKNNLTLDRKKNTLQHLLN